VAGCLSLVGQALVFAYELAVVGAASLAAARHSKTPTVLGDSPSSWAMALFDCPSTARRTTFHRPASRASDLGVRPTRGQ
jgi:hypothetical protein